MVKFITTALLVTIFFLLGHITQAIKKILSFLVNILCKILSLVGIKINRREHSVKVSDEFKETYKDIKRVKLSKKNIKQKSSIDWVSLSILVVAFCLFIANLDNFTGNAISNWLCDILPIKMKYESMNTFYTASLFSIISFCASRILSRWKETKQQRVERKNLKLKQKALLLMDSKELLDGAKKKDAEKLKELIKE